MFGSPNLFAYLALIAYVPLGFACFFVLRAAFAVPLALLIAALFLPQKVAFDPPFLPPLDKTSLGILVALVGALAFAPRQLARARPGSGLEWLALALAACTVGTSLTNGDRLIYPDVVLPALSIYDSASASFEMILIYGIPFFLGRALIRDGVTLRWVLVTIVSAAMIYILPILWELRMSPTLHRDIYGFFQSHFGGTKRFGGYRPMVFFQHGLALSLFVLIAALAAVALQRARSRIFGWPASLPAIVLPVVLVACKSLGTIVYGALMLPAMVVLNTRWKLRLASVVAGFVILYPTLRSTDLLPTEAIVAGFRAVVPEQRAHSLEGRFYHEGLLLDRARERFPFGWGSYGRFRVHDAATGLDESVTDGFWVIQLGAWGLPGFLAPFALLLLPVVRARRHIGRIRARSLRELVAGTAIILSIWTLDLLPNAFLQTMHFFAAGALWGAVPGILARQRLEEAMAGTSAQAGRGTTPLRVAAASSSSRRQGASARPMPGRRRPGLEAF